MAIITETLGWTGGGVLNFYMVAFAFAFACLFGHVPHEKATETIGWNGIVVANAFSLLCLLICRHSSQAIATETLGWNESSGGLLSAWMRVRWKQKRMW